MLKIKYSGKFQSEFKELVEQNSELQTEVDQRIKWFRKNPADTRLDNHALTGNLEGKWAFSITDDVRVVYEWRGKTTVRLLKIGSHVSIYRN